jgi:hypothetical protein
MFGDPLNLIRLTPSKGETAIRDRSILFDFQVERFFILECGGKRSATPLWIVIDPKRRRRFALPAHSKWRTS